MTYCSMKKLTTVTSSGIKISDKYIRKCNNINVPLTCLIYLYIYVAIHCTDNYRGQTERLTDKLTQTT